MLFILKILIFSSIILIFTNFSDAAINLLIVAPNLYQSHFSFHKKLALLLMEKEWVEKVNVLLPVLDRHNKNLEELAQHSSKLQLFYYYFNNKEEQINLNNQTFYNTNEVIQNTCLSFFTQTPVCLQHCLEGIMTMFGINENQQIVVDAANPIRAAYENKFLDMAKNFDWIQTMQSQQFQLGIAELYDPIAFYIFRLIGIPHIIATSCLPLQSIYYHYLGYLDKIIEKGDIPELCSTTCNRGFYYNLEANYCTHVCNGLKLFNIYDSKFEQIFQHYNKTPEKFENIFKEKTQLIFVNQQTFTDFVMPEDYPENVVNIGGIVISDHVQGLTPKEKEALENAKNKKFGLIYLSFGTLIDISSDDMNEKGIYNILNKFYLLSDSFEVLMRSGWTKYMRLLKREFNGLKNVHAKSWMNQQAILAHKSTKIFISHCGINSVLESIKYGVPLICVPFFGDQFYNSEALAKRGVAIVLDKNNDFVDLDEKIETIANDISYFEKMKELQAEFMQINPKNTFLEKMEELVWNIENGTN